MQRLGATVVSVHSEDPDLSTPIPVPTFFFQNRPHDRIEVLNSPASPSSSSPSSATATFIAASSVEQSYYCIGSWRAQRLKPTWCVATALPSPRSDPTASRARIRYLARTIGGTRELTLCPPSPYSPPIESDPRPPYSSRSPCASSTHHQATHQPTTHPSPPALYTKGPLLSPPFTVSLLLPLTASRVVLALIRGTPIYSPEHETDIRTDKYLDRSYTSKS